MMTPNYIPKYIIKRLVPKDSIKKEGDTLKIKFVNVLSPITVSDEFPDDLSGMVKVKVDGKEIPEDKIFNTELEIEGKTYKVIELKELKGETIPVGAEIMINVPDKDNIVESGKTYTFSTWIAETDNLSFEIERTVN